MTEREVTVDNLNVFIRHSGKDSRKVLMLHGWGGTSGVWEENIKQLSKRFECVACDLPGFGRSENPSSIWAVEEYSEFVYKLISHLGWEKFCLIGKSFGGRVAIKYAVNHASTLNGLILVDAAGTEPKGQVTRIKIFLAQVGKRVVKGLPFTDADDLKRKYYSLIGANVEDSETRQKIKKRVTNEDLTNLLSLISVPTLVIWGEKDEILPVEIGKRMALGIPDARFELIRAAGHNAHQTHNEAFNAKVQSFLDELE